MNITLRGFIKKELTQTLRDKRMRIVVFLIPLIQLTIFGLALSNEIKNIRLKVFYAPNDIMARRIEERAMASGWFVRVTSKNNDPFDLVKKGQADAVLVVPAGGLTKSVERQDGRVQLLVDASNSIRARAVEAYIQSILQEVSAERIRVATVQPLRMDVRMLFNASMRTPVYLVPGVMCMILCLITIILTSMSMAREKEMGTFETLLSAPVDAWEILLGKTLPFVLLGMIDVPLILCVATFGFDVPIRGALWEVAVAALVFICTTVAVGTLISTFSSNQQQAMMGGFLFLFPAIQLSGVMAPLDNIPFFLKIFARINPLNYFVTIMRNIMLKGGDPSVVWTCIGAMVGLCILLMSVSFRRFHKKMNQ